MARGKKVATATTDQVLSLDKPESICPEVQPPEVFVPHPTSAPTPTVANAAWSVDGTAGYAVIRSGSNTFKGTELAAMPTKKASAPFVGVENSRLIYPEHPNEVPFWNRRMLVAWCSNSAPIPVSMGVNIFRYEYLHVKDAIRPKRVDGEAFRYL